MGGSLASEEVAAYIDIRRDSLVSLGLIKNKWYSFNEDNALLFLKRL